MSSEPRVPEQQPPMFPPFISRSEALPPLVPSLIGAPCGTCVSRRINTRAAANAAGSTVEIACTINGCDTGAVPGAVYCITLRPTSVRVVTRVPSVELPPEMPSTLQVTPELTGPLTVAVKDWMSPGNRVATVGDRVITMGLATLSCALPDTELLAAEVAVTVSRAGVGTRVGAV